MLVSMKYVIYKSLRYFNPRQAFYIAMSFISAQWRRRYIQADIQDFRLLTFFLLLNTSIVCFFRALYVNIVQPTPATTIILKFVGVEHYYYSSIQLDSERDSDLNRILQESKEHLACQDIIVFDNRSEPIPIGSYVFPFQFKIPRAVPGTFHLKSAAGPFWEINVTYKFEAVLADCQRILNDTRAKCDVLVHDQDEGVQYCDGVVRKSTRLSRLLSRELITEASLNTRHYCNNDRISLTINFTTKGNPKNTMVDVISVQLLQRIQLTMKNRDKVESVLPTGAEEKIYESVLRGTEATHLINSLDSIIIPLPKNPISPTTNGQFVTCKYWLEVRVTVHKVKEDVCLEIPFAIHVDPESEPGWKTSEPPWAASCELKLTQHSAAIATGSAEGFFRARMPHLYRKLSHTVLQLD